MAGLMIGTGGQERGCPVLLFQERKAVSSADWGEPGGCANDVRSRRIAPARNELHNGSSKSEREATSGRSTNYGRGHLVPAFLGIGRNSS
jgi:hypothetical protein